MTSRFVEWVKAALLEVQEYVRMIGRFSRGLVTRPFYYRDVIEQFEAIGVGSLTVVLLTGMFTGMVLALHRGTEVAARYSPAQTSPAPRDARDRPEATTRSGARSRMRPMLTPWRNEAVSGVVTAPIPAAVSGVTEAGATWIIVYRTTRIRSPRT